MRPRGGALVVALALLASGCSWSQWGGNAEHNGVGFVPGLTKAAVSGWVMDRVADVGASGPVVTANGLGFVVQDGRLVAFDVATNAVVWVGSLPAGSTAGGAPAINADGASSTVFVAVSGAQNPFVMGFDVDGVRNCNPVMYTCSPVFVAGLGTTVAPLTPLVVHAGKVFGQSATRLAAFDAKGQVNCGSWLGMSICTPLWSAATGGATSGVGPTATGNGVIYAPGTSGANFVVRAFDEATGALLWSGSLASAATATPSIDTAGNVFVPTGSAIRVFGGNGCGASSCAPLFTLAKRSGDAAGNFLATPAFDGTVVYSTNANGTLSAWSRNGCGSPSCQPTQVVVANTPVGGSSGYRQSPVVAGGIVFLIVQRSIGGANHMLLVARDGSGGSELASWDLGVGGFGTGLANASIGEGIVYAPVAGAVFSVHPKPVRPLASLSSSSLALSPAFDAAIFDYVVHCAAGTNSLTLTMSATPGGTVGLAAPTTTVPSASQTTTVPLTPNQAAVIRATDAQGASAEYWIRCLPPDFPAISATRHPAAGAPTPGWYLLSNTVNIPTNSQYAMILDTHGTPVWYKRSDATVVDVTPIARNSVAYMPNNVGPGFNTNPDGRFDVYSLATNAVQSIRTVGIPTDVHELQTLPNGNHLLLSYPFKGGVDLTGLAATPTPGPDSTIADCVVQEVTPQGNLVWQWTASDHINPVTESLNAAPVVIDGATVYDVFHCNSIDASPSGNLLVSARHLNAVFEIRRSDGTVVWKLGGTPTNKDGAAIIAVQNDPQGGPALQHDARYMPNGHISMFDNQATLPSRGIEYSLNLTTNTAEPVFSYNEPGTPASCCMGSFRRYPDGHRVIGWGYLVTSTRAMTELDAAGLSVLDIDFPAGKASYRAVKVPPPFYNISILRNTAGT